MPQLHAFILDTFSQQQKKELIQAFTDALINNVAAARHQTRIMIGYVRHDETALGGEIGAPIAMLFVYMLRGRTDEQKANLIRALAEETERILGVDKSTVRTLIQDMQPNNVGIGANTALALGR
ncbi:MAG: tautomerase family protein [Lautropia sp.]